MPAQITVDENYLRALAEKLMKMRSQVTQVRAGVNPLDPAHPHGERFNSLQVRAGSDKFAAGVNLKSRIAAVGSQADQKLTAYDQRLSSHAQGIAHIISSSDNVERANTSYATFNSYLGGPSPVAGPVPGLGTGPATT